MKSATVCISVWSDQVDHSCHVLGLFRSLIKRMFSCLSARLAASQSTVQSLFRNSLETVLWKLGVSREKTSSQKRLCSCAATNVQSRPGQVHTHIEDGQGICTSMLHTHTSQPHFIDEARSPVSRTDSYDWRALKNSWFHHPTFQWGQNRVEYTIQPLTLWNKSDITSFRPLLKVCYSCKAQV